LILKHLWGRLAGVPSISAKIRIDLISGGR
jgi:hypothetical protein